MCGVPCQRRRRQRRRALLDPRRRMPRHGAPFPHAFVAVLACVLAWAVCVSERWVRLVPSVTGARHAANPYETFAEFYGAQYAEEHADAGCRLLHCMGVVCAVVYLAFLNAASLHKSVVCIAASVVAGLVASRLTLGTPGALAETVAAIATCLYCIAATRHSLRVFVVAGILFFGAGWVGHTYYAQNTPATLRYPTWSFMGDLCAVWGDHFGR